MSRKILDKNKGTWLVQVQRNGKRVTRRGKGGVREARKMETLLTAQLEAEAHDAKVSALLNLEVPSTDEQWKPAAAQRSPTLRDYFESRWTEHAKVVQNEQTRRTSPNPLNYILCYLGHSTIELTVKTYGRFSVDAHGRKKASPGLARLARRDPDPEARRLQGRAELRPLEHCRENRARKSAVARSWVRRIGSENPLNTGWLKCMIIPGFYRANIFIDDMASGAGPWLPGFGRGFRIASHRITSHRIASHFCHSRLIPHRQRAVHGERGAAEEPLPGAVTRQTSTRRGA